MGWRMGVTNVMVKWVCMVSVGSAYTQINTKENKMYTKETKCTQIKQNILHNKRYKKVRDECSVVQVVLCMVHQ